MQKAKNSLLLFTHKYPFGNQESFLENEIIYLSQAFKQIILIPEETETTKRPVPENVETITLYDNLKFNYFFLFIRYLGKAIKYFSYSLLVEQKRFYYIYHVIPYLKYLLSSIHKSKIIEKYIQSVEKENCLFYTYWFLRGNLPLAILKSQNKIPGYISRAHGYDLYDEQQGGLVPFRAFKMKHIDRLFPISRLGANYVKERINKQLRSKITPAYLGTRDFGISPYKDTTSEIITIVSCSNIIPLKRVSLIINTLSLIDFQLKWHHFGDGNCENEVKLLAESLPENIDYRFWGRISNIELIEFYKNNQVTLFLNLSASEGIPVSIMEAASFGIPAIATDVGGVKEIVNEQTGILVNSDASAESIAQTIISFIDSDKNSIEFRNGVRNFWKDNFEAEKNYNQFIQLLHNTVSTAS
ncbi:glycosyltransferase [Fulvivirgaceae bacterium BMA12]|uniref:Glycosyltransferase n=1 Tax=Agaribacillus aureus TaxID=3051825 RepID=A0ABT8LDX2_9BACT|nr:glycosyltransferase [Fulvivirgaceae bacterium BMA12]